MSFKGDILLKVGFVVGLVVVAALMVPDYAAERAAHERILLVRGEAVLSALEGGLSAHRRLGGWFRQNVNEILEATAATSGILGLAVFQEDGARFGAGGDFPDNATFADKPVWVDEGLLMSKRLEFAAGGERGPGAGRGMGPPWGRGRGGGGGEGGMGPIQEPFWLVVLLDASEYRAALKSLNSQLIVSLFMMLAVAALGVMVFGLRGRQRRLGAELELAHEREARLEEMTRLGAGLAHETRNPIGVVRGLAQSLADNPDKEERWRKAQQIVDESDRLVSRINSFLQYARPPEPELAPIQLDEIAAQTAELFRDESRAREIDISQDLAPVEVAADSNMVRQVLVNLLANALSACEAGSSIEVRLRANGARGFALEVRDTGAGIATDDLPHVTKPYFTRRSDGVGLGLSIVQQIVRAHGWTLGIDSKPGEGTAVTITGGKA